MTIKSLPAAPVGRPCAGVSCEVAPSAVERWNGGLKAAVTGENSISIFDVIGQDYWGEGSAPNALLPRCGRWAVKM